jgi:type IV secretory pathway protease TraF
MSVTLSRPQRAFLLVTLLTVGGALLFHRHWSPWTAIWNVTPSVPTGLYGLHEIRPMGDWPASTQPPAELAQTYPQHIELLFARSPWTSAGLRVGSPSPSFRLPLGSGAATSLPLSSPTGVLVYVSTPHHVAAFSQHRGYRHPKGWLLKRIAGLPGDVVCRDRWGWSVNAVPLGPVFATDSSGRSLPHWEGCLRVGAHQVVLAGDHPKSFDSRYFGPVSTHHLLATGVALWIF